MSETGNLLGEAASLDPAIRERVITLANMALDQAEFLMKHGDPIMKGKLIQSFMTTFAKHMRTQDTNDEMEELRNQMRILQAAVLGRAPGELAVGDEGMGEEEPEMEQVVDMPPGSPQIVRHL